MSLSKCSDFSVMMWNFFAVNETDGNMIAPHTPEEKFVFRRDGSAMTEEDDAALLPYSGMVSLLNMISDVPLVGDLETPLIQAEDTEGGEDALESIQRKDGTPMDSDDNQALFEYSGMLALLLTIVETPIVGDLEASPFDRENTRSSTVAGPFDLHVRRRDGMELGDDDAAVFTEFAPLFYINLGYNYLFGDSDAGYTLGTFPVADDDLTAVGLAWGQGPAERSLARVDGDPMSG
jgi:hypothetical protein